MHSGVASNTYSACCLNAQTLVKMAIEPAGLGPRVIGVYAFFLALTTVAITLRTYCRVYVLKNFALDDWLAVTAWVRSSSRVTMIIVVTSMYTDIFVCSGPLRYLWCFCHHRHAPWHRSTRMEHPPIHRNPSCPKSDYNERLTERP